VLPLEIHPHFLEQLQKKVTLLSLKLFLQQNQTLSEELKLELESSKWKLWHGLSQDCLEKLINIKNKLFNNENKKLNTLISYIENNLKNIINYEFQRNNSLPYTSNVIESAVDTIINERQKNNKKMSWTRQGAHNILQIRASIASKTWERDWEDAFEVWIAV
jgi:hypothetical protein